MLWKELANRYLVGWLVGLGWLVSWLVVCLFGLLVCWLAGWFICCLFGWLLGWLVARWADALVVRLRRSQSCPRTFFFCGGYSVRKTASVPKFWPTSCKKAWFIDVRTFFKMRRTEPQNIVCNGLPFGGVSVVVHFAPPGRCK